MNKKTKKAPKYTVINREGAAHGGLYELEQEFFIDIVETKTQKVIKTFSASGCASFGTNGMWSEYDCSGVEKVEITPDEKAVLVYKYNSHQPEKIDLP